MTSKVSQKKNLSSMQVLKTLKLLMDGDYTMYELIENLNKQEKDAIFNNSVVSKYINTCRYLGIEIPKINNKYYIARLPFGIDISDNETNLITNLYNVVKNEMSTKSFKIFDTLVSKLNRYAPKKIVRLNKNTYQYAYEAFEQAIRRKRKVSLFFKNRIELVCIPIGIVEKGSKTFFKIYNKRERLIDFGRLSGLEVLKESYKYPYKNEQVVVYALKNKLAERYELNENESLDNFENGVKVIVNKGESQEELFSRLLRYDTDCEILKPMSYRDDFKKVLEDTLSNYGE